MSSSESLSLSRKADDLFSALREEICRLESERARFHELPPDCRLGSLEVYDQRIQARQALLSLLDEPASRRPQ